VEDSAATKGEPAGDPYMNKVQEATVKAVDLILAGAYIASHYKGRENRKRFNIVQTYCMFIVYPRSERTYQAAPLNAHTN
jgi:hypothetical protein